MRPKSKPRVSPQITESVVRLSTSRFVRPKSKPRALKSSFIGRSKPSVAEPKEEISKPVFRSRPKVIKPSKFPGPIVEIPGIPSVAEPEKKISKPVFQSSFRSQLRKPPSQPFKEIDVPFIVPPLELPHTASFEEDAKPTSIPRVEAIVEMPGIPVEVSAVEEEIKLPIVEEPKPRFSKFSGLKVKPISRGGFHASIVQAPQQREKIPKAPREKEDASKIQILEMRISSDIPHIGTFQPHRIGQEKSTALPVSGAPLNKPTLDFKERKVDFSSFNIEPINIPILEDESLFAKNVRITKNLNTLELPIFSTKVKRKTALPRLKGVIKTEKKEEDYYPDMSKVNTKKRGKNTYTMPVLRMYIDRFSEIDPKTGEKEKPSKGKKQSLVDQLTRIMKNRQGES